MRAIKLRRKKWTDHAARKGVMKIDIFQPKSLKRADHLGSVGTEGKTVSK
jgi:hypothetical protein